MEEKRKNLVFVDMGAFKSRLKNKEDAARLIKLKHETIA